MFVTQTCINFSGQVETKFPLSASEPLGDKQKLRFYFTQVKKNWVITEINLSFRERAASELNFYALQNIKRERRQMETPFPSSLKRDKEKLITRIYTK